MELRICLRYILWIFIFSILSNKINSQVKLSAKLKSSNLKVKFCNMTDKNIIVPNLSVRYGIDKKYLFESYYTVTNDTLMLSLTKKVDSILYTVNSREQNNDESNYNLIYEDKLLLPKKCYCSKIKLRDTTRAIFLIINYENLNLNTHIKK